MLHMTKVAYGAQSLADVRGWFAGSDAELRLTTRYLPRRHAEMVGGSLYWILHHTLIGRSPILGFEDAPGGRTGIVLAARLIDVHPMPRRAHQGWRYLAPEDAPPDLGGADPETAMPASLVGELAKLGLV